MDPKETPAAIPAAAEATNASQFGNGIDSKVLDALRQRVLSSEVKPAPEEPPKKEAPKEEPAPPAEPEAEVAEQSSEDLSQSEGEIAKASEEVAGEAAEETEQSGEDEARPEDPEWFKSRLGKITKARREAEEKAAALEQRVRELEGKTAEKSEEPPVSVDAKADPFAGVWSERALDEEYGKARDLKRWCEKHADGAVVDGKEYSSEEIREIRYRVEDALEVHIPRRAAFLAQHKQLRPVAERVYPWWKDRTSADYQTAQEVLRNAPHLLQHPDYQVLVGDFLEGRKARLAREAAAKAPPKPKVAHPVAKPAPKQPAKPAAAPARVDEAAKAAAQRKANLARTGSVSELVALMRG